MKSTRIIDRNGAGQLPVDEVVESGIPAIVRGAAADWPLVGKGLESPQAAIDYLASFDAGRPIVGYVGAPEIGGRFFYNDDITGMNFEGRRYPLTEFLGRIRDSLDDPAAPALYVGSTDLDTYLPGLRYNAADIGEG